MYKNVKEYRNDSQFYLREEYQVEGKVVVVIKKKTEIGKAKKYLE